MKIPLTKEAQALLDALRASPEGDAICKLYRLTRTKKTPGKKKKPITPYAFAGSYAYMDRAIAEMEANGEKRNISEAARRAAKLIEADVLVRHLAPYTARAIAEMKKNGEKRDLDEAERRGKERQKADRGAGRLLSDVLQAISPSTIRNRYNTVRKALAKEELDAHQRSPHIKSPKETGTPDF